ncbi:MAG TPA: arginine repressor, partial [Actinomycetota bacterium]
MKRQRQQAILELVRREPLSSQRAILDRLREQGFEVTQPTVSRDLDELGLARVRDDSGRLRYAAPQEAAPLGREEQLRHVLQEFALAMVASGNLVVVRTPPGAANAVAQVLDRVEVPDVI